MIAEFYFDIILSKIFFSINVIWSLFYIRWLK
ncbi:hypothetical protein SAMN05444283_1408 [Bacteroides stercoris]|nr:hypothetical protein SAMN05444283_1408 [Bacteroides stercoris]